MIDLIDECSYDFERLGYKKVKAKKYDIDLLSLHVDSDKESKETGFDKGDYFIINAPLLQYLDEECFDYVSMLFEKRLKFLIKKWHVKKSKTLLVGLGNPEIWADRFGVEVCRQFALDKFSNVKKFCPNVYFETGIATFEVVKALVEKFDITFIIVLDALCTNHISRLGCSIQLTTTGMTPGSGVIFGNKRICKKELGVPCFSIGVPFMINSRSLGAEEELLLCPKDVKENVQNLGYIISHALEGAL